MTRWGVRRAVAVLLLGFLHAASARAQITFKDVSPDRSSYDSIDPDAASGGRTNAITVDPNNKSVLYAATEWGGLYKSTNGGNNWTRLDGHRPVATWDVKVDPSNSNRVYATSFFDGRASSLAGINVSTDGGTTWTRPASATPPLGFCANPADRTEPSAFGISIDPTNSARVYVGTSCGLAISTDSGVTWTYSTPIAPGTAVSIWDVAAEGNGSGADMCGAAGHYYRSTGGGWIAGSGLPSGMCSIAVNPYDPNGLNLFATVGTSIYETTDGFNWAPTRTNPNPQGRIPFVATNKRSLAPAGRVFDLWFGDTSLYRVQCDSGAAGVRCGSGNSPAWSPQVLVCSSTTTTTCTIDANCPAGETCKKAGYTRSNGGHDDMGGIAFDPSAANDACPIAMSSDGGVFVNLSIASPTCQTPSWEQPIKTPHALWPFSLSGADLSAANDDHVYFGNQDNGEFGAFDAGQTTPAWTADTCCDIFDNVASNVGAGSIIYSGCCSSPRATNFKKKNVDFSGGGVINYPSGGLTPGFKFPDVISSWGSSKLAMLTVDCSPGSGGCVGGDGGLYITTNVDAVPIVWTELGNATEPQGTAGTCSDYPPRSCNGSPGVCGGTASCLVRSPCAVYTAKDAATFYVQTGSCDGNGLTDELWRFTGTNPAGSWTQVTLPGGASFGIFAVDPANSGRLIASAVSPTDALMYRSGDGGANWTPMPALDSLMRGGAGIDFPIKNTRGPAAFTSLTGYYQPTFAEFDPIDPRTIVAGGADSGLFYTKDDGASWQVLTDPRNSHTSGIPHLPRPRHAYFSEADHNKSIYVSSQGRGVWRLGVCAADAYEPDDGVANQIISGAQQTRSLCGSTDIDFVYFVLNEPSSVTMHTDGTPGGDTTLTLLDSGSNQIAFDDDSGTGSYSSLARSCGAQQLSAGTYFIKVSRPVGTLGTIQSYTLSFAATPCCGNGAINPGETCDDGNRAAGDCCSATCTLDAPGTACEDGNGCTAGDSCGNLYSEGLDGVAAPALPASWSTSGTGTLWSTTTSTAHTPPNSAGTDDPAVVTDKRLDSPTLVVTAPSVLSFRNSYNLENTFDGAVLEIKIGAGAFQDIIAAGGSWVTGGYPGFVSSCCGNPLASRQAWTGNSGGFISTSVNLPAAAVGQNVVLRWRVGTDNSQAGVGQNLDTITVTGVGSFGCHSGPAITAPGSVGTITATSKTHFDFPAVSGATRYDVLRGLTAALPVGPGGGDEVCANDVSNSITDTEKPSSGTAFWYLARAENTCGNGAWGNQSNGTPRVTTTCP